jgi:YHS domain-containing protein
MRLGGLALAMGLAFPGLAFAQHGAHPRHPAAPNPNARPAEDWTGDPYLLDTDPVSGQKLGDRPIIHQHEGRELRFAGEDTLKQFRANPARYLPAIDQQMIRQQLPLYPLDTCLVSGKKLGAMGKPVEVIYRNRLVRFCCDRCPTRFQQDVNKYIGQLDQAVIATQHGKHAQVCPVSSEKLGGEMGKPVDVVVGNRRVELCCKECVADLRANPLKYLALSGGSAKPAPAPAHDHGGSNHTGHAH